MNLFQRPYLQVDDVTRGTDRLVLSIGKEVMDLQAPPNQLDDLDALITSLRDPDSAAWKRVIADAQGTGSVDPLIHELDAWGLLRDADDAGLDVRRRELEELADARARLGAWLKAALSRAPRLTARLRWCAALLRGAEAPERVEAPGFFDEVIALQVRTWRRDAPLSEALAAEVLAEVLAEGAGGAQPHAGTSRWAAGPYDIEDTRAQVYALFAMLVLAEGADNQRMTPPITPSGSRSGLNLMIDAERQALTTLRTLGRSRYHEQLEADPPDKRMILGTYVEQYHVTRRFVEVIVPLLSKRVRRPLRTALFRYYADEVGHEKFELEACEALGADRDAVTAACPLPLFTAYIDALQALAHEEPVSFLVCVLVTEGLPGSRPPVGQQVSRMPDVDIQRIQDVIRRHELCNSELDHTRLPRRLLSYLPSVGAAEARQALDRLDLLLELTYRSWQSLADWYGSQPAFRHHGWLDLTPDALLM